MKENIDKLIHSASILLCALDDAQDDEQNLPRAMQQGSFVLLKEAWASNLKVNINTLQDYTMYGNGEAALCLSKIYKLGGILKQPKDEAMEIFCMLIGQKLGNEKCSKIIQSNQSKYNHNPLDLAAKHFQEYYCAQTHPTTIDFKDAVLTAITNYNKNLDDNNQSSILGDSYFNDYCLK